ncbi:MAG: methylamine utilization protein [Gammaproteobacteria bacterium]|nr:methylamine utilization protein [Gammaproteobacteria bacterium]
MSYWPMRKQPVYQMWQLAAAFMMTLMAPVFGATLEISIVDANNEPVPNVAVYVTQTDATIASAPGPTVMDQRDTRFKPHILVIQKGTAVEFPNSDVIAHHVYSFSKPNDFVLPLYKGNPHEPVLFEHEGIVTLGCNIHDYMLGYIVVVDTDVFGLTDEAGKLSVVIDDNSGAATVSIWSPRIRDQELTQVVTATSKSVAFSLKKKLGPAHDPDTEAMQWTDY